MVALTRNPPPFISLYDELTETYDHSLKQFTVLIKGTDDSLYKGEEFKLYFTFPDRYPFDPPKVLICLQLVIKLESDIAVIVTCLGPGALRWRTHTCESTRLQQRAHMLEHIDRRLEHFALGRGHLFEHHIVTERLQRKGRLVFCPSLFVVGGSVLNIIVSSNQDLENRASLQTFKLAWGWQ